MQELTTILFENEKIRVEKIESFGCCSPCDFWYEQTEDEWVQITKGTAILDFGNEKIALNTHENYYIKAYQKHRVEYTSTDCEWLCLFIKTANSKTNL